MAKHYAMRGRKNAWLQGSTANLLKGLLCAAALTAVLIVVFALIVGWTDLSDSTIRMVNQAIKVVSIVVGVFVAVDKGSERGALQGALLGCLYMALGVLIYAVGTGQHLTWMSYVMDVLIGISIGGLTGLLRKNQCG